MGWTEEYRGILAEYSEEVQKVQQKRKFFDGVLGLGSHPGNAPCHEIMDRKAEDLCNRAAQEAGASEAAELAEAIFRSAAEWKGPEYARLMLVAIQRHTLSLLPGLENTQRESLREWYEKAYPRRMRLPVQEQVLKQLKRA